MRTSLTALVLGLSILVPLAQAECRSSWEDVIHKRDASAITIAATNLQHLIDHLNHLQEDSQGVMLAQHLLERARDTKLALGDIKGRWKVRSIQGSQFGEATYTIFAYPAFNARIKAVDECELFFEKTSGSQRRTGRLFHQQGHEAMVFLGGASIGDEPTNSYDSEERRATNVVGRLVRISANELLMIMDTHDYPHGEGHFELYYLFR